MYAPELFTAFSSVNESSQTPIQDFLDVLWSQRLLVAISVVAAVALALGLSLSQAEKFRATASLAFDNLSEDFAVVGSNGGVPESPSTLALRKSQTVLRTDTLEAARTTLGGGESLAGLRRRTSAAPEVTSNLVVITAEGDSASRAAATANAVAEAAVEVETQGTRKRFSDGASELRRRYQSLPASDRADIGTRTSYKERISRLDALASVASPVRLDEGARPPDGPYAPRPLRAGIVAGFVGLLLGLGLAFGRNALDRRLRGIDAIRSALDLPMIGQVRDEAMGRAGMAHAKADPLSEVDLEGFRILRANLEFLGGGERKTFLVTSPLPEEGKSTVAASLAWASAMSGRRTLLVECDLRRPSLAGRLGVDGSPGLVDLLSNDAGVDEVTRAITIAAPSRNGAKRSDPKDAKLDCVLAGRSAVDPAAMLGSEAFRAFINRLSAGYDIVIIDSAPLLPVVDTLELFPCVDAAILCIRDGRTTRDQAEAARDLLDNLTDRPVALVITGVKRGRSDRYGYYHSYAYEPQRQR